MIDLDSLTVFIRLSFRADQLYIDRFKQDVLIVEIDCLSGDRKLALRSDGEKVEFSTVSKEPQIDFSLYDYSLKNQSQVEKLIIEINKAQTFLFPEGVR